MSDSESGDDYDLDAGPDPAGFAAAAPEAATDDERPVHAVGIGPGNPEFLTPRGARAIREADVVVGFGTVADFAREAVDADTDWLTCGYRDEGETLATFAERVADGDDGTAVLMGDPNHSGYQFVGKVQRAVDRPVRVVPGISSLQVAASRAGRRWRTASSSRSTRAATSRPISRGSGRPATTDTCSSCHGPTTGCRGTWPRTCSTPARTATVPRWSVSG